MKSKQRVLQCPVARKGGAYPDFGLVDAEDFADLLAAFVELKRGQMLHVAFRLSLLIRIDINFGEYNRREFFLHFFKCGRDYFAGPAPHGFKLYNNQRLQHVIRSETHS